MPSEDIEMAQDQFLHQGGLFVQALKTKWKSGELIKNPDYSEYPKMLRISEGVQTFNCSTKTVDNKERAWTEEREVFREIIVSSEEEEERVLAGGKSSAQMEEDRQELIRRCRSRGILVDASWSVIRLRRELGDKLNAPEPADREAELSAELAKLRRMSEMEAEIRDLKARLAGAPDDTTDLRAQLAELGVTPDKRWGAARLREELERATAPEVAA